MEPNPADRNRIPLNIDNALLEQIDEWRFRHHAPNRNEAIRDLIRRGLENDTPEGKSL